MSDEGRVFHTRATDVYSPWKTFAKGAWALIAGFVAYVAPDLANAAILYFADDSKAEGLLAGIPEEYKPAARLILLALIAAGRNWQANRKKA